MFNRDRIFVLYANCLPVRGARRSAIFDVQRGRIRFIPNALYKLLSDEVPISQSAAPADEVEAESNDATIAEYFAVLTREGYGMWTDEPERFPPLNLEWRRPEAITNALIDVDRSSGHNWPKIRRELDAAGCIALELRFYDVFSLEGIALILSIFAGSKLRHISMLVCYSENVSESDLETFCRQWPVISSIWVHSSPRVAAKTLDTQARIHFTKQILSIESCGHVSMASMAVNLVHFTEARRGNSCLNRKVGIDVDGQVGSCPACSNKCSPVNDATLKSSVANFGLQTITQITKDEVKICRDCEFRYVCTDCRVFRSDPSDLYSKPANCSYNPYTATWENKGSR